MSTYTICQCGHPASEHSEWGCNHKTEIKGLGISNVCDCRNTPSHLATIAELQLAKIDEDGKKLDAVLDELAKR